MYYQLKVLSDLGRQMEKRSRCGRWELALPNKRPIQAADFTQFKNQIATALHPDATPKAFFIQIFGFDVFEYLENNQLV